MSLGPFEGYQSQPGDDEESIFQSQKTEKVIETLKFVKKFCGQTILVKIGGAPLEDPQLVEQLCQDFSLLRAAGISLVLVHGGGKAINRELNDKGIEWQFHHGLRVTSKEMMSVIESVLCGQVNGSIVRTLNSSGVSAIGLSGADTCLLQCVRKEVMLGEVGEVTKVNAEVIAHFLNGQKESMQGVIPVIAPLGVDENGRALNVNADWACLKIAEALAISKVLYLTDQDGILDDKGHLISETDVTGLQDLIAQKVVQGGMLAKVQTVLEALRVGVEQVHIINGSRPHSLIEEIFTDRGIGTVCRTSWDENQN